MMAGIGGGVCRCASGRAAADLGLEDPGSGKPLDRVLQPEARLSGAGPQGLTLPGRKQKCRSFRAPSGPPPSRRASAVSTVCRHRSGALRQVRDRAGRRRAALASTAPSAFNKRLRPLVRRLGNGGTGGRCRKRLPGGKPCGTHHAITAAIALDQRRRRKTGGARDGREGHGLVAAFVQKALDRRRRPGRRVWCGCAACRQDKRMFVHPASLLALRRPGLGRLRAVDRQAASQRRGCPRAG